MELTAGLLLLGILVGTFGTLIGAGGGFILLPLLILVFGLKDPEVLTTISLAVVFVNALSGSIAYGRMKRIDYFAGLAFAAATIPGAIAGAIIVDYLHPKAYNGVFGLLLLAASIFLLVRPKRPGPSGVHGRHNTHTRTIVDLEGRSQTFSFNLTYGIVISVFVGFVSSLLGIGGGIMHVPMMTYLLNFPVHIATATSQFTLTFMAAVGTVVHIARGTFGQDVMVSGHSIPCLAMVLPIAAGTIIGAQLGAKLSQRLHGVWIIRLLAVALATVAGRILYTAFF